MVNFNSSLAKMDAASSAGFVGSYGVNTLTMTYFKVLMPGQAHGRSPENLKVGSQELLRSSSRQCCRMTQPNQTPKQTWAPWFVIFVISQNVPQGLLGWHAANPAKSGMFRSSMLL